MALRSDVRLWCARFLKNRFPAPLSDLRVQRFQVRAGFGFARNAAVKYFSNTLEQLLLPFNDLRWTHFKPPSDLGKRLFTRSAVSTAFASKLTE